MALIADGQTFHPAIEWLKGDGRGWDGISRVNKVLGTLQEPYGSDKEYLAFGRTLILMWLTSAIACLHGYSKRPPRGVLVLVGEQQVGKTSWFKYLFPEGMFFDGAHLDPKNKDSIILLSNYWGAELGEIDATFRSSDISALKAYIGSDIDEIRAPYAPKATKMQRRTVLAGSCNHKRFNHDDTGATRFWPVEVEGIDLDTMAAMSAKGEMRQFWLEIESEYYGRGFSWQLDAQARKSLNLRNEAFTVESAIAVKLDDVFDWNTGNECRMNRTQIMNYCGISNPSSKHFKELGDSLRRKGVSVPINPRRLDGKISRDIFMPSLRD